MKLGFKGCKVCGCNDQQKRPIHKPVWVEPGEVYVDNYKPPIFLKANDGDLMDLQLASLRQRKK